MDEDELELADEIRAGSYDDEDSLPVAAVELREPSPLGERSDGAPAARRGASFAAIKIGIVFVLLGGGVAFLLLGTGASDAFVYSKLVDEVMSDPERYRGRELRVEGQLQPGSIVFQGEPECEHRFVLARGGHTMPVRFPRCVVPDTFRDDMRMDVVVQGQLQADGSFLANQIIPRCPSKYEMRELQRDGEDMPHLAPPSESGQSS